MPVRNNYEKRPIFVHSFRGFRPWLSSPVYLDRTLWWQESVAQEFPHLIADRKQRTEEKGGAKILLRTQWSSSVRCCPLKFPESLKQRYKILSSPWLWTRLWPASCLLPAPGMPQSMGMEWQTELGKFITNKRFPCSSYDYDVLNPGAA